MEGTDILVLVRAVVFVLRRPLPRVIPGIPFHDADALSPTGRRWTFTFSLCAEFLRNRLTLYIAQKWKNSG